MQPSSGRKQRSPSKSRNGPKPARSAQGKATQASSKKPDPTWMRLGIHRVTFVKNADTLSRKLLETYGPGITISQFEKALEELKGQSSLRDMILITDEILALHVAYALSKKAMIDEQNLFRSSFQTEPVRTPSVVQTVEELFSAPVSRTSDQKEKGNRTQGGVTSNSMETSEDTSGKEEVTEKVGPKRALQSESDLSARKGRQSEAVSSSSKKKNKPQPPGDVS